MEKKLFRLYGHYAYLLFGIVSVFFAFYFITYMSFSGINKIGILSGIYFMMFGLYEIFFFVFNLKIIANNEIYFFYGLYVFIMGLSQCLFQYDYLLYIISITVFFMEFVFIKISFDINDYNYSRNNSFYFTCTGGALVAILFFFSQDFIIFFLMISIFGLSNFILFYSLHTSVKYKRYNNRINSLKHIEKNMH